MASFLPILEKLQTTDYNLQYIKLIGLKLQFQNTKNYISMTKNVRPIRNQSRG